MYPAATPAGPSSNSDRPRASDVRPQCMQAWQCCICCAIFGRQISVVCTTYRYIPKGCDGRRTKIEKKFIGIRSRDARRPQSFVMLFYVTLMLLLAPLLLLLARRHRRHETRPCTWPQQSSVALSEEERSPAPPPVPTAVQRSV